MLKCCVGISKQKFTYCALTFQIWSTHPQLYEICTHHHPEITFLGNFRRFSFFKRLHFQAFYDWPYVSRRMHTVTKKVRVLLSVRTEDSELFSVTYYVRRVMYALRMPYVLVQSLCPYTTKRIEMPFTRIERTYLH